MNLLKLSLFLAAAFSCFATISAYALRSTESSKKIARSLQNKVHNKNASSDQTHSNPGNTLKGGSPDSDVALISTNPQPNENTNQRKVLDAKVFKGLLKDLLDRVDNQARSETLPSASSSSQFGVGNTGPSGSGGGPRHINSLKTHAHHCILRGLWLSTVAGSAIELHLEKQNPGHIEVHTKIFELPDNPYPPLITSQWTGKGIISQESPTTITIVFQEHVDTEKENHAKEVGVSDENHYHNNDHSVAFQLPRTAVFVGQCVVCHGNPMLQGSWIVFPATQTCNVAGNAGGVPSGNQGSGGESYDEVMRMASPYAQDSMYLILRYK